MHVHEDVIRASERSVWVTQILFALVLANGLVLYKDLILHPFGDNGNHLLGFIALAAVYLTTLLSWVDFSRTMHRRPYFYGTRCEKLRFIVDVMIVISYAYLLFSVEYILKGPDADITRYIVGYPIIYLGYLLSGILRIWMYGRVASRLKAIIVFLVVFSGLLMAYRSWYPQISGGTELNFLFVLSCGLAVLFYRVYRRDLSKRFDQLRDSGLRIGIDVDGVLADQISGVLPIIERKYGMRLEYTDITDWRLPLNSSSIDEEIELALRSERHVRTMPIHQGARQQLRKLIMCNKIIIVTARSTETDPWTIEWLLGNRISYDEYINSRTTSKSQHDLGVLIDDYVENIKAFLTETYGYGILFDRPWNKETAALEHWQKNDRLVIVSNWQEVREAIAHLRNAKKRDNPITACQEKN